MDEHQQTDEQFVYTFHNELLPSQVDAFLQDKSPDAYSKLLNRLLAFSCRGCRPYSSFP